MKVIVTEGLLAALERSVSEHRSYALRFKQSKEYSELDPNGSLKRIVDKGLEGELQDCDLIEGWLKRIKESGNDEQR